MESQKVSVFDLSGLDGMYGLGGYYDFGDMSDPVKKRSCVRQFPWKKGEKGVRMWKAIHSVRSGERKSREAIEHFDVPKRTFYRYLKEDPKALVVSFRKGLDPYLKEKSLDFDYL